MPVDTVTTFFALLAVLGLMALVAIAVVALVSAIRGGLPASLVPARHGIGQVALPLAFGVALTCMLGSLYLSEIAKFPPCELCWFQRIVMYPLVVILAVATLRRDATVKFYVLPLVVIGFGISTYHYLVERFPDSVSFSCTGDVPCSTVWVWKFHFLSVPAMAGIGFLLIAVLCLLARPSVPAVEMSGTERGARNDSLPDESPSDESDHGQTVDDQTVDDQAGHDRAGQDHTLETNR